MVPPIPRSPRGEEVCNISENCFCTVLRIEGKDASGTSDLKGRSSPHPISVLKSLPRDREAADADHSRWDKVRMDGCQELSGIVI